MMIGRFNRLFAKHGKILFAIFTVVIGVSFVGFFTPGFNSLFSGGAGPNQAIARAFGKSFTQKDFEKRSAMARVVVRLNWTNPFASNPQFAQYGEQMLNQQIQQAHQGGVNDLIMLEAAKELGIRAADKEVIDTLKASPNLTTDGKYDNEKYENFLKSTVYRLKLQKKDLDDAVRQYLTIQKVQEYLTATVFVSDAELKEYFKNEYTKVTTKVASFSSKDYTALIPSTDKELKEYFDKNKESYKDPETYQLLVARFKYSSYEEEAKKALTPAEIKSYYEANKAKYKVGETQLTLEEATAQVKDALAKDASQNFADKAANTFGTVAYQAIKNLKDQAAKAKAFETAAVAPAQLVDAGWVAKGSDDVSLIGKEPAIAAAAGSIYEDIPVSDPVRGTDSVYVLFLKAKKAPDYTPYEKAEKKVREDFIAEKALEKARTTAKELAATFTAEFEKGTAFDAVTGNKLFKDVAAFSPAEAIAKEVEEGSLITATVEDVDTGAVSPSKETAEGALVVYVVKREVPADDKFEEKKADLKGRYVSLKTRSSQVDFRDWVSANIK